MCCITWLDRNTDSKLFKKLFQSLQDQWWSWRISPLQNINGNLKLFRNRYMQKGTTTKKCAWKQTQVDKTLIFFPSNCLRFFSYTFSSFEVTIFEWWMFFSFSPQHIYQWLLMFLSFIAIFLENWQCVFMCFCLFARTSGATGAFNCKTTHMHVVNVMN